MAPRPQLEAKQDEEPGVKPTGTQGLTSPIISKKGKLRPPKARKLPEAHSLLARTPFPSQDLERVQSWPFLPQGVWG